MAKQIVYLITDNGIDGLARTSLVAAFWSEADRDEAFAADQNRAYYGKDERIIDPAVRRDKALDKLDSIDKLVLELV